MNNKFKSFTINDDNEAYSFKNKVFKAIQNMEESMGLSMHHGTLNNFILNK